MVNYNLLSYGPRPAEGRAAICLGEAVYDAEGLTGRAALRSVLGILEDWPASEALIAAAAERLTPASACYLGPLSAIPLLAPILYPGSYFCAAANYRDHSIAMAKRENRPPPPDPRELNIRPYHFVKSGKQATVGPNEAIGMPGHSKFFDWELELGAVIGRPCRNVASAEALDYVAGYTLCNDLSIRDPAYTHRAHVPPGSPFSGDFLSFKGFDKSALIGPWITPAAQIGDPGRLKMKLWVNDQLMQDSDSSQMIFSVAEQIAYLSERITLLPGDVIMTGTPAGTGVEQERFLQVGDSLRMWIETIGEMQNTIRA